jgi:Na+-driven multidrug efflux pump
MENLESSLAMTWYDYRKSSWAMLTLALPLMSGFFLQYAQGFIGLLFMGRLGSTELASATLAMSFFNNTAFTIIVR